ncbi:hypothetical protein [Neobacillus mesonae]|uniref:hypothetical protein n=1 Tax=Neobacillus mesonae TaxID=1193713 RepID=UPI00203B401A|nr:hypothetical protein [Neobacillus mesonae]MCM3569657.1 hypothetical protein [Neobacillus mesonae]
MKEFHFVSIECFLNMGCSSSFASPITILDTLYQHIETFSNEEPLYNSGVGNPAYFTGLSHTFEMGGMSSAILLWAADAIKNIR